VKAEFNIVIENSKWLVGNGESVNFWLESWCGPPLATILNIHPNYWHHLTATVSDFIRDSKWSIPISVQSAFPTLRQIVSQVTIPFEDRHDRLVWINNNSGDMTFKDAFLYKCKPGATIKWAKSIWCPDIPPSKSMLVWRLMQDKLPTDENLMIRGCSIPSMCSSCYHFTETSFPLFF